MSDRLETGGQAEDRERFEDAKWRLERDRAMDKKLATLFCNMCGEPLPHSDISDGAHVCRSCWEREVDDNAFKYGS